MTAPSRSASVEEDNLKDWSASSRSRKFGDDKFSTGSGNTFWCGDWRGQPNRGRATAVVTKTVRVPPGLSEEEEKAWKAPTEFEVETGLVFSSDRRSRLLHSLDKKNRWSLIGDQLLANADMRVEMSMGKKDVWTSKRVEAEHEAFVMFQPKTYQRKETKEDREMTAYFEHLATQEKVLARRELASRRSLRLAEALAIPKGVLYPRLNFTVKPRTGASDSHWRNARVEDTHHQSFWAPAKLNDASDYIEIDLGKVMLVAAIGTKGRAAKRDADDNVMEMSPSEWVSQYKLFWKKDEKDVWKSLGEFSGNSDTETEVAHPVISPHTEQPGLLLRFLRIQPMGYHHRKSMRIGVYGQDTVEEQEGDSKLGAASLDDITSRKVRVPSVIYTVLSSRSKRTAGKWGFARDTFERGPARGSEKRRLSHHNHSRLLQYARNVQQEVDGEDFAHPVSCSASFPRQRIDW